MTPGYALVSPDERNVFVMLAPSKATGELYPGPTPTGWTLRRLRSPLPYPSSGLYRNDHSIKPLWTWRRAEYLPDQAVAPSEDGVHLVAIHHDPRDHSFRLAVYARGRLVRSWSDHELIGSELPPQGISHFDHDSITGTVVVRLDYGAELELEPGTGAIHRDHVQTDSCLVYGVLGPHDGELGSLALALDVYLMVGLLLITCLLAWTSFRWWSLPQSHQPWLEVARTSVVASLPITGVLLILWGSGMDRVIAPAIETVVQPQTAVRLTAALAVWGLVFLKRVNTPLESDG